MAAEVEATNPRLLGRAIGRHLPAARFAAGLALTLAALAMLAWSGWAATARHHEPATPPMRVCISTTGTCVSLPGRPPDQAVEDQRNHENRVAAVSGALTSGAALVLGWRLWRSPWRRSRRSVARIAPVAMAVGLSPVAAVPIFVVALALAWSYLTVFG